MAWRSPRTAHSYDHLDETTIRALGDTPRYFVPLGNKAWFTDRGFKNVVEGWRPQTTCCVPSQGVADADGVGGLGAPGPLRSARGPHDASADWWDSNELGPGVRIVCTPCQHFRCDLCPSPRLRRTCACAVAVLIGPTIAHVAVGSEAASGRWLHDRNRTLWASWVVDTPGQRFFFGGDTAYRAVPKDAKEDDVPTCPAFKGRAAGQPPLTLRFDGARPERGVINEARRATPYCAHRRRRDR